MGFFDGFLNLLGTVYGTESAKDQDEFNRQFNAIEAQKNRDFQTAEREATQDFNIDMWNMNNEYNSLSSQMSRAKEAGVNPSALLGSSGGSGSIANPVSSSPMSGSQASFSSGLSSSIANNFSSLAKNVAETELIGKQAESQGQQNDFFALTKDKQAELITKNVQLVDAQIQRELATAGEKVANTKTIEESFKWISHLNAAELQVRLQTLNNLRTDNFKTIQEYLNLAKEGKWIDARNQATIENIESSTSLNNANASLSNQETSNSAIYGQILSLQNDFSKSLGIPLGTPEFQVQWWLYCNGKLNNYVDGVITPREQATWKPGDYNMPRGNYHYGSWRPRTGVLNPHWYYNPLDNSEISTARHNNRRGWFDSSVQALGRLGDFYNGVLDNITPW